MKILLLGYLFGSGGIQNHTHYLAKGLSDRGHEVIVVTPAPMKSDDEILFTTTNYRTVIYRNISDVLNGFYVESCDIAVMAGTGWKAMVGMLRLKRPCIRVFFEVMSGCRYKLLDPRLLVHLGFDAIIGQARQVEQTFAASFSWCGERTHIPALPIPLELMCSIPRKSPRLNSEKKPIKMVYFGRLAAHKGLSYIVSRWQSFAPPGTTLDIWGEGPSESELTSLILENSLHNHIRLMGRYPDGQSYVELIQQYDLKLLPTTGDEGAPLVLLEAMACGLPFVANGVGGIRDYENKECAITCGDIEQYLPMVIEMLGRLDRGEIDNGALQDHYWNNYSYKSLLDKWEGYLESKVRV